MTRPTNKDALLSVDEVAERLNCATKTVRRMIANDELEALRIGPAGRLIRVSEDAVRTYLATRRV